MARELRWKRAVDVAGATLGLLLLAPLFALVAVAIRLDSRGPVFYRQQRVGREGRPFEIVKFRSMVTDADRIGPYSTALGDARITRVGAFLRRSSLDELPQLINVLKGDMSLVGPRPDVPAQRETYLPDEWDKRHRVRPGITGLAQATVRSDALPGERKKLDLEYVDTVSFRTDMRILMLTARQVTTRGSF